MKQLQDTLLMILGPVALGERNFSRTNENPCWGCNRGARRTFKHTEINSPLRSNATLEAVGGTAVYLASDAGSCTTGEVIYVDGGYHVLGMPQADNV